jgi:putative tryptophan/tyrosine transport system substrate-binding protein
MSIRSAASSPRSELYCRAQRRSSLKPLRLPAIYEWPETAEEGGFAAYGPRLSQLFVEVMTQQLVKLFHGIKVADIPIEQPTSSS